MGHTDGPAPATHSPTIPVRDEHTLPSNDAIVAKETSEAFILEKAARRSKAGLLSTVCMKKWFDESMKMVQLPKRQR